MEQPTQEQIKEFWEWCGWEYSLPYTKNFEWQTPYWHLTGQIAGMEKPPTIDLNNLFKYAVPKYRKLLPYELLFEKWLYYLRKEYDPALALFWALWQVKEVNNGS